MLKFFLRCLSCVALIATLGAGQATQGAGQSSAGQKKEPVYQSQSVLRATTRLVIVDVVAVDDKGRPVTDLTADDFVVTEDGKPQKISDFSFHQPVAAAPAQKPAPGIISNTPEFKNSSCLNVILLDAINTDFSDHAYAQDMLAEVSGQQSGNSTDGSVRHGRQTDNAA